jgi:hypothetical protein
VIPLDLTGEVAYHDPFMQGDAFMSHGIRNALGYHGNELNRYQLFWTAGLKVGSADELFRNLTTGWFPQMANLHWLYTNTGDLPAPFEKVAGPVQNAAGTKVWLYRIPGDHPLAWVTPAIVKGSDERAFATLIGADVVRSVAIFPESSTVAGQVISAAPAPLELKATTTRYAPGAIDIELDAPAPAKSALMVAENFYPGWTATIDGKPATVERADYVLMGMPLPEGAKQISLRFTSPGYEKGKTITCIALALAVLLAIGGAVVQRRGARG